MALLQVVQGLTPGQQFVLDGDLAVLGRHPDCDIVLDVGAVSRQHAQIVRAGGEFFVEDLGSRNGTFVNDQLVRGRQPLNEGDQLKICDLVFSFHQRQPGAAPGMLLGSVAEVNESSLGLLFEDHDRSGGSATIMSTINVASSRAGLQVSVNPETKLKALLEITRNLGSAIELDEVLRGVLDSLFKIFIQADRGFVALHDTAAGALIPKAVKHRNVNAEDTIRISRTIVNQVMQSKEAILSADAASDSRFDTSQSIADFRIRSMMCAPLVHSDGEVLGVIQIDTLDQRSRFQQDDLDVLAAVACQAATAVENAQLHEAAMRRKALERDLALAHRVQQGFLPEAPPQLPGYDFFNLYTPANQVGGDYFDYVQLPGKRLGVVVADVSGKGISAALITARLSSEVRYLLASEPTVASAMDRLNAGFNRPGWEDRFITCVIAVINLETNVATVANAGHMAPLVRRRTGLIEEVGDAYVGLPLGVDADTLYEEFELPLVVGDVISLYTDGISEAMNVRNELYGMERLRKQLLENAGSAHILGQAILADVRQFVGQRAQSDDVCLVCFGRTEM